MLEILASLPSKVNTLLTRVTSTRSTNLDLIPGINTNVVGGAKAATALSNVIWTSALASKLQTLASTGSISGAISSMTTGYTDTQGYIGANANGGVTTAGMVSSATAVQDTTFVDLVWIDPIKTTLMMLQPVYVYNPNALNSGRKWCDRMTWRWRSINGYSSDLGLRISCADIDTPGANYNSSPVIFRLRYYRIKFAA